jgi:hypothetical protein
MTETSELARETAKAAALVKETAERTATALNIQYIQKDVAEIKLDIKQMTTQQLNFLPKSEYDVRHEELIQKMEFLTKIVYMGMGGVTALTFVLKFFIK